MGPSHGTGGDIRLVPQRSGGRTRWLAVPDPALGAALTAAVTAVAGRVQRVLGPEVIANRVTAADPSVPSLSLEDWVDARKRFALAARSLAGRGTGLLALDVRACYASIPPSTVARSLVRLGCGPRETLSGSEPSAVLANAVLARADGVLRRAGVAHLRWVDEFWISIAPGASPSRLSATLTAALRPLGLALAPEKARFLPGSEVPGVDGGSAPGSCIGPGYHRRSDAHPVPGLHGPHAGPSPGGGVGPGRRPARGAGGLG